jgi:hypothetical protein
MNEIIKSKKWTKNWSGNWSLLFASLYGDIYTKGLKNIVNKNVENFIITFENGVNSNALKIVLGFGKTFLVIYSFLIKSANFLKSVPAK